MTALNKDSMAAEQALIAAIRAKDSLKQDAARKSEMALQFNQSQILKNILISRQDVILPVYSEVFPVFLLHYHQ